MAESVNNRHGNGLVLILLALSILAIVWLFTPFIAYLFLSLLICISTYGSFSRLSENRSKNMAALIMTLAVTWMLIQTNAVFIQNLIHSATHLVSILSLVHMAETAEALPVQFENLIWQDVHSI